MPIPIVAIEVKGCENVTLYWPCLPVWPINGNSSNVGRTCLLTKYKSVLLILYFLYLPKKVHETDIETIHLD